jgi:hypothetical protein
MEELSLKYAIDFRLDSIPDLCERFGLVFGPE